MNRNVGLPPKMNGNVQLFHQPTRDWMSRNMCFHQHASTYLPPADYWFCIGSYLPVFPSYYRFSFITPPFTDVTTPLFRSKHLAARRRQLLVLSGTVELDRSSWHNDYAAQWIIFTRKKNYTIRYATCIGQRIFERKSGFRTLGENPKL